MKDHLTLAAGAGGKAMAELLEQVIRPTLRNPFLDQGHDGAYLPGNLCMTTDAYVIRPLEFPGGDIGKLAVCGTVNDLAMCGAKPLYLSLNLILEEGLEIALLRRVLASLAQEAAAAGVQVVTGDTKVVERGKADGIFIVTTGIGQRIAPQPFDPHGLQPGDQILLNGPLAQHGMAILAAREQLPFETPLTSDCAALHNLVACMLAAAPELRLLRDPTRGGVAATCNELAQASQVGIQLQEAQLPLDPKTQAALAMMGLDGLTVANEGKLLAFCPPALADRLLQAMQAHPLGRQAAIIGEVVASTPGQVWLHTQAGGKRLVDMPLGEQLPRIC